MGVVHLALDPRGRAVAIKVLRPHVADDDEARVRLRREVDTLSRVRDPRVASVIDADVMAPRPYIVTRYVAGPALDDWVETQGGWVQKCHIVEIRLLPAAGEQRESAEELRQLSNAAGQLAEARLDDD